VAHLLQKLAASLDEKELSPETGISASDEYQYEWAIDTFLQYGKTLEVISQINTHGYNGMQCQLRPALHTCWQVAAPGHDFQTQTAIHSICMLRLCHYSQCWLFA